jgi:hypothetical protein
MEMLNFRALVPVGHCGDANSGFTWPEKQRQREIAARRLRSFSLQPFTSSTRHLDLAQFMEGMVEVLHAFEFDELDSKPYCMQIEL